MARGRMINQKIASDIDFNEMSVDAQFIFMRAIPFLDRDGLVTGHPTLLWSKVAPLLAQYAERMDGIMNEWLQAGFVLRYMDGKTPVLFFKGFHKNQSLTHYDREAASDFAPPPGYIRTAKGMKADDGGENPDPVKDKAKEEKNTVGDIQDVIRTYSGPTPDQIPTNGMERNVKRTTTTTAPAKTETAEKTNSGGGGGGSPEVRNRRTDEDFARLCLKFETEGFGTLTQIMAEEISALLDEFPVDWISDAMTVAVSANKRQSRYVRGILVKWRADGRSTPGKPAAAKPALLSIKRWCLDKYYIDNPDLVQGVAKEKIYAEYEQYRHQYQQAH